MAHIENADLGVWNATAVAGLGVGLVPRQICRLWPIYGRNALCTCSVSGWRVFKMPRKNVYMCILDDFGCFGNVYVWRIYETMLAEEVRFYFYFLNVFGTCVLPKRFLLPPTGHLCRVQVSLYNARVEIG